MSTIKQEQEQKCQMCKRKFTEGFHKLPFGEMMCDGCIHSQCERELDDYERSNVNIVPVLNLGNSRTPAAASTGEILGVKLFKLKEEIDEFKNDLNHFSEKIFLKKEKIKLAIDINFNFCKQEIESQKASELQQLDVYKNNAMAKIKMTLIDEHKNKLAIKQECLNRLKQGKIRDFIYTTLTSLLNLKYERYSSICSASINGHFRFRL